MAIILDLIIICIILFFVFASARHGFVRTFIEIVGFFLALYLSINISSIIATSVYDNIIKEKIVESVSNSVDSSTDSAIQDVIDDTWDNMPKFVVNVAENFNVSKEGIIASLKSQDLNNHTVITKVVDYAAKPIIVNIIKVILYIIIFVVLSVLVKFLSKILNRIFNLPLLGGINKTLGGIFGLAKGIMIATALCVAISIIVSLTENGFLIFTNENINSTYIFKFLTSFNPLKK